jgi:hypothetical protein
VEWLPNRLTPLYSKNHYEEEDYLTVKIGLLYTQLLPIVMVWVCWYINILVYYISISPYFYILNLTIWLSYPLFHSSTGFILLTSLLKSYCNSLIINTTSISKSVTLVPSSLVLSLKILPISKSLIRGVLCPNLIY